MGFELSSKQINTVIKPSVSESTTPPHLRAKREERPVARKTAPPTLPAEAQPKTEVAAKEVSLHPEVKADKIKSKPKYDHTRDLAELAAGFLCVINGLEPAGQLAKPLNDEMGLLPVAVG